LNWLVRRRWLQFAVMLPMLAFFVVFMIAGFLGSPIGNRNIIITFVWILWWFLLIAVMLPFGSRIWCLLCPFPFFGEWFQRRRLLGPPGNSPRDQILRGLKKKWPRKLSNIWLQNVLFLGLCTFSAILVTRPVVSAFALGGLAVVATVMHLVYPKRTFCAYVCPVSGFLGLYSMAAMVEVRARDPEVCKDCRTKGAIVGSQEGWSCPWFLNPSTLDRNNYCGFCMECIKACSYENMTLRARPFCSDINISRYDEAWKAFIMIALALVYSVTLLSPWGTIKAWANVSEVGDWQGFLIYAGTVWSICLAGLPAVWAMAAWLGKYLSGSDQVSVKEIFLRYTYLLVPLGLLAWIAFSIPLIMVNGSYIISTLSDPMGWGWNLFGTADFPWTPFLPEYIVYIQIPLLLIGLGFSLKSGYIIAKTIYSDATPAVRSLIPVGIVCTAITTALLRLFAG
jgi:polyferredoxin